MKLSPRGQWAVGISSFTSLGQPRSKWSLTLSIPHSVNNLPSWSLKLKNVFPTDQLHSLVRPQHQLDLHKLMHDKYDLIIVWHQASRFLLNCYINPFLLPTGTEKNPENIHKILTLVFRNYISKFLI